MNINTFKIRLPALYFLLDNRGGEWSGAGGCGRSIGIWSKYDIEYNKSDVCLMPKLVR